MARKKAKVIEEVVIKNGDKISYKVGARGIETEGTVISFNPNRPDY